MAKHNKLVSLLLSAGLLMLAGCGQKGPLYLADEEIQNNQQQTTPQEQQAEQQ